MLLISHHQCDCQINSSIPQLGVGTSEMHAVYYMCSTCASHSVLHASSRLQGSTNPESTYINIM